MLTQMLCRSRTQILLFKRRYATQSDNTDKVLDSFRSASHSFQDFLEEQVKQKMMDANKTIDELITTKTKHQLDLLETGVRKNETKIKDLEKNCGGLLEKCESVEHKHSELSSELNSAKTKFAVVAIGAVLVEIGFLAYKSVQNIDTTPNVMKELIMYLKNKTDKDVEEYKTKTEQKDLQIQTQLRKFKDKEEEVRNLQDKVVELQKRQVQIQQLQLQHDNTWPRPFPSYRSQFRHDIERLQKENEALVLCMHDPKKTSKACLVTVKEVPNPK